MQVTQGEAPPVQQLYKVINERVEKLVRAKQQLLGGIPFWGQNLFTDAETEKLSTLLGKAKEFLESLQAYNTPGKLKNFKYDAVEVKGYQATFSRLKEVEGLQTFCGELAQLTQYLSAAETVLREEHPWVAESKQKRAELLAEIRRPAQRESESFKSDLLKQLKKLKSGYIKVYLDLYRKARLSLVQDKEKKDLLQDFRLKHLRRLASVEVINCQQLTEFDRQLDKLRTGTALTEKELELEPKSPDGFWPSMEDTSVSAETRLKNQKSDLERIQKSWTKTLLNDLADPVIQSHFDLLKPAQKKMLKDFMAAKELPDEISQEFLGAIQQALSGLAKLPVRLDDLKKALFPDGSPATPAEFKERFAKYLDHLLKSRAADKVRLVIE
jgi:Asp-tRNA(Asn)/Glu-tRNA(Gln) amidotransferase C subunit